MGRARRRQTAFSENAGITHKLNNTQYGSLRVAEDKAKTALDFRRPSKVFEDLVAQGGIGMPTQPWQSSVMVTLGPKAHQR
jgi:uncharacterized protein GlcG (DUF336 family)